MNAQKKIKVIDSVFFTNEIDYLLFRFTELNDSVDMFVILEQSTDYKGLPIVSEFERNIEKFEQWKEKIIHIKSNIPSDDDMEEIFNLHDIKNLDLVRDSKDSFRIKQLHDLKSKLDSLELSFDDIIMVSNIDEIPVVPPMSVLQPYLTFDPVIFSQKDFIWSKDFCKLENHSGTLCFSYSHLVIKTSLFTSCLSKSHNLKSELSRINSGYRFSYFNSIEENVKEISQKYNRQDLDSIESLVTNGRNNLFYYNLPSQSNPRPLKKYVGELPKNIDMLNSQSIGRVAPKKHLVIIGIDTYQDINAEEFESISIVTHTNIVSTEKYKQVHDNIKIHYIQIPNEIYYDVFLNNNTLEDFQKIYFLNEIKKIITLQFPLDIDIFEFYFSGKKISYPWSIIKDRFIYDLLHN
jgi:hypothetical protein